MKKLFTTNENIADRAFVQSIAVSVVGILLCIVALCSATYAWFVADISSQNTISAAYFDLDVTVYDITQIVATQTVAEGENGTESQTTPTLVEVLPVSGEYELKAGHSYQVMLTMSKAATASKGYCDVVVMANGATYRTETITNEGEKSFQFVIQTESTIKIIFLPKWGEQPTEGVTTVIAGQSVPIGAITTPSTAEDDPASTEPATEPTEPATEPTEPATEPTDPESNNE